MDVWQKGVITNVITKRSEKAGIYESLEVYVGKERYFKNFLVNHPNNEIAKLNIYYLEKLFKEANIYTFCNKLNVRNLVNLDVLVTIDYDNEFKSIKKIKVAKWLEKLENNAILIVS